MDNASYLETHRFSLRDQSFGLMKQLRDNLSEINNEFKVIKGLAFFGSRTKGLENADQLNISDLDLCVFYDGSAFGKEIISEEDLSKKDISQATLAAAASAVKNVQLGIDQSETFQAELRAVAKSRFENDLQTKIASFISKKLNTDDKRFTTEQKKSILTVDISEEATDRLLHDFYYYANIYESSHEIPLDVIKLISRFFLGVGDSIYKNRKYILDQLSQKNSGEFYFKKLMQCLSSFERPIDGKRSDKPDKKAPPYTHYPQTIEEGRKYFLTK